MFFFFFFNFYNYLIIDFSRESELPEFMKLDHHSMKLILAARDLDVKQEITVLNTLESWLNHNYSR